EETERDVVIVGDAKNLQRTLLLAAQVAEMEIPFVLCLNMMDEARARGIAVREELLSERLGVPVVSTVAVRREGIPRLFDALKEPGASGLRVEYPEAVEDAIEAVTPLLPLARISPRALALIALAAEETLSSGLWGRMKAAALERLEAEREGLGGGLSEPVAYVVNRARLAAAARLAEGAVAGGPKLRNRSRPILAALERATTHRFWGLPVLAAVLYACYQFVGVFGAKTLVDLLEDGLFRKIVSPAATA